LSVHSYPSPHMSPSLSPELVDLILTYALKTWGDLVPLNFHFLGPSPNPNPNLAQGAPNQEGDIRVLFTTSYHDDGYPFDGRGGTLAHAFFPGAADLSGDVHFDDGDSWSYGHTNGRGTTDLFTVAVHEFGHSLGLSHSSAELSIMRPFYQGTVGNILNYTLSTDDRLAIQALYGKRGNSASQPTLAPNSQPPHHSRPPHPREAPQPDPALPNRCEGKYDAIANIRGELLFFKGPYFWRIQRGSLLSTRPILIHSFWVGLPERTTHVDAVYERTDRHIVFFIGSQYWMFRDTFSLPGYPRPLRDWAMRTVAGRAPERVEAAFVWAHNGKTYLFSKGEFWRFDETEQERKLEAGYPKMASLWSGVPSEPDDIISWGDGDAYFFKDISFWVLKRGELDQGNITPKSVAVEWMECDIPTQRPTERNPNHRVQDRDQVTLESYIGHM
ncbi:matrix metalloproteinase-17-like, partial [Aplochiton taeniatus]